MSRWRKRNARSPGNNGRSGRIELLSNQRQQVFVNRGLKTCRDELADRPFVEELSLGGGGLDRETLPIVERIEASRE